jgi:glycosyltransferase involved in cell wall biosynthesis
VGVDLEPRIDLPGYIPAGELDRWRLATSIALAPYRPVEGFSSSGALTWAFGAGVPIVASRVGPFVELQEEAGCLELVAPEAPRELAYRIRRLDADPERAAALAGAVREHARRCSWERVAEMHAEVYARCSDQAAASRTAGITSWRSARSASRTNGSRSSQDGASASRPASIRR